MGHEGGRAKVTGAPSAKGRATKDSKVGRGLTYQGVPNEDCYPELNALSQREPVGDIPHIGRNVVKFRYPTNQAGGRAQNAVQAVHDKSDRIKSYGLLEFAAHVGSDLLDAFES